MNTKESVFVSIAVVLLFLHGLFFYYNEQIKNRIVEQEQEIDDIVAWKEKEHSEGNRDFLRQLARGDGLEDISTLLAPSGVTLVEWKEERQELDDIGIFLRTTVKGRGTFSQIVSAFGIIGNKNSRVVMNLTHLSREGRNLLWEAEILTYRYRGTYAETEFGSHRADGNGEKSGGEAPR